MKNLKQIYLWIKNEIDSNPWYEKTLWKIMEFETELIKVLNETQGEDWKIDRDKHEKLTIEEITWDKENINWLLDKLATKLQWILDFSNPFDIILSLNIRYHLLEEQLLPAKHTDIHKIHKIHVKSEKEKINANKFWMLLDILLKNWIFSDDLIVSFCEKNLNKGYFLIYIPRINKSILINNNYNQATYILDWIVNEEKATNLSKEELLIFYQWARIKYWNESKRKWEIKKVLFWNWNWHKYISKKINLDNYEKYKQLILNEFPTCEDFMKIEKEEIDKLHFNGKWITFIWNSVFNLWNWKQFRIKSKYQQALFASKIYEMSYLLRFIIDKSFAQKYVIKNLKSMFSDEKQFIQNLKNNAKSIKFFDFWLVHISSKIFDLNLKNILTSEKQLAEFALKIYGNSPFLEFLLDEKFAYKYSIEQIKLKFPKIDDFMNANKKQLAEFEIFWKWLIYLTNKVFWLNILSPINSKQQRYELAKLIYHNDEEKEIFANNDALLVWIIAEIKQKYPDEKIFMQISWKLLCKLKFKWKWILFISNSLLKLWIKNPATFKNQQALLASKIYWESEYLKFFIDEDFATQKCLKEIKSKFPTPNDLLKTPKNILQMFKINWKWLIYVANIVFKLDLEDPLSNKKQLEILAERIYSQSVSI